jgi:hypothetical protein
MFLTICFALLRTDDLLCLMLIMGVESRLSHEHVDNTLLPTRRTDEQGRICCKGLVGAAVRKGAQHLQADRGTSEQVLRCLVHLEVGRHRSIELGRLSIDLSP